MLVLIQRYRVLNNKAEDVSPDNFPGGTLHVLFHLGLTTALQRLRHCPCSIDEEEEDKEITQDGPTTTWQGGDSNPNSL